MQSEKKACDEFFKLRDQRKEDKEEVFVVQNLEKPKMHSCMKEIWRRSFHDDDTRVVFRTRSIGTQTSFYEYSNMEDEKEIENDDDEKLPLCEKCGKEMSIHGPLGLKRSSHFGKYFLLCNICHKRPDSKTKYFKLGFKPRHLTNSTMPRNMREIEAYIDLNK